MSATHSVWHTLSPQIEGIPSYHVRLPERNKKRTEAERQVHLIDADHSFSHLSTHFVPRWHAAPRSAKDTAWLLSTLQDSLRSKSPCLTTWRRAEPELSRETVTILLTPQNYLCESSRTLLVVGKVEQIRPEKQSVSCCSAGPHLKKFPRSTAPRLRGEQSERDTAYLLLSLQILKWELFVGWTLIGAQKNNQPEKRRISE